MGDLIQQVKTKALVPCRRHEKNVDGGQGIGIKVIMIGQGRAGRDKATFVHDAYEER